MPTTVVQNHPTTDGPKSAYDSDRATTSRALIAFMVTESPGTLFLSTNPELIYPSSIGSNPANSSLHSLMLISGVYSHASA